MYFAKRQPFCRRQQYGRIVQMNRLNDIIIFAFRYALERRTGAPCLVINFIKKNITELNTHDIAQIIKDIERLPPQKIDREWQDLKRFLIDYNDRYQRVV